MANHSCKKCGQLLTGDEIALHMKLLSRAATSFFCLNCLAEYCSTTPDKLKELIVYYHQTGICTLFTKWDAENDPSVGNTL